MDEYSFLFQIPTKYNPKVHVKYCLVKTKDRNTILLHFITHELEQNTFFRTLR